MDVWPPDKPDNFVTLGLKVNRAGVECSQAVSAGVLEPNFRWVHQCCQRCCSGEPSIDVASGGRFQLVEQTAQTSCLVVVLCPDGAESR